MNAIEPLEIMQAEALSKSSQSLFVSTLRDALSFTHIHLPFNDDISVDRQFKDALQLENDKMKLLAIKAIQYDALRKLILKSHAKELRSNDVDLLIRIIQAHGELSPQHAWNFHSPLATTLYILGHLNEAIKVVEEARRYIEGSTNNQRMNEYARQRFIECDLEGLIYSITSARCYWERYRQSNWKDARSLNETREYVVHIENAKGMGVSMTTRIYHE